MYIKCTAGVYTLCDLLPMATDEQFSSIEYLSINHSCTFNELCTLISYLPELRRLTFSGPNDDDDSSTISGYRVFHSFSGTGIEEILNTAYLPL